MDPQIPAPAYVIISTADAKLARKLVALTFANIRRARFQIDGHETVYEMWLDRMQPGVLTVFPPLVDDKRSAIKVLLDGIDASNGHCTFRAFTSRERAIGFFQRHDGTLENVDDATKGDIIVKI